MRGKTVANLETDVSDVNGLRRRQRGAQTCACKCRDGFRCMRFFAFADLCDMTVAVTAFSLR